MSRHPTHRRRQGQVLVPEPPRPAEIQPVIVPAIAAKAVPRRAFQPIPWYLMAPLGAWVIIAIWSALPGSVDIETEMYLPYHLSNKPFFSRIFDSKSLEWEGSY